MPDCRNLPRPARRPNRRDLPAALAVCAFVIATGAARAADPLPAGERERVCWLSHTRERTSVRITEPTAVDFSNLKNGDVVRSPFLIDFSIRGMGVVPAGKPHPKAGHHHLLVDRPLPLDVRSPIPFSDTHRHYGKAQTGTTLALPPGKHTLRLLFADHDHRPYYVYSPEITVTVTGPRTAGPAPRIDPAQFEKTCPVWYAEERSRPRPEGKRVLVTNLRNEEPVISPFVVRFAADGLGVAPKGHGGEGLGRFVLEVSALGNGGTRPVQRLDLANGTTQANLFLPPGPYRLRLHLVDENDTDLVAPSDMVVQVTGQERS